MAIKETRRTFPSDCRSWAENAAGISMLLLPRMSMAQQKTFVKARYFRENFAPSLIPLGFGHPV